MIALNTQPKEALDRRDDGGLEVVGEPWLTIQGEGPFAGERAVFVRLAGCNLDCPQCDTDYTGGRRRVSSHDLLDEVYSLGPPARGQRLVVFTGGEPLRQSLGKLTSLLLAEEANAVQIETNGTLYDPSLEALYSSVTVVCSPKSPKVHHALWPQIDAYKYVLDADHVCPEDGLPTDVLGTGLWPFRPQPGFAGEVYLQPADAQDPIINQRNLDAVVQSCLKYGYRLSVQLHKIVGLP